MNTFYLFTDTGSSTISILNILNK